MVYTLIVIRNGADPEQKKFPTRHDYECAKTALKKIARRNRRAYRHGYGEVLAVIPQMERI